MLLFEESNLSRVNQAIALPQHINILIQEYRLKAWRHIGLFFLFYKKCPVSEYCSEPYNTLITLMKYFWESRKLVQLVSLSSNWTKQVHTRLERVVPVSKWPLISIKRIVSWSKWPVIRIKWVVSWTKGPVLWVKRVVSGSKGPNIWVKGVISWTTWPARSITG